MTLGPRGHYATKIKRPGRPSPSIKQHLGALRAGNWGCFRNAPLSLQRVGRQGCLRPSAELGTPSCHPQPSPEALEPQALPALGRGTHTREQPLKTKVQRQAMSRAADGTAVSAKFFSSLF